MNILITALLAAACTLSPIQTIPDATPAIERTEPGAWVAEGMGSNYGYMADVAVIDDNTDVVYRVVVVGYEDFSMPVLITSRADYDY